MIHNVSKQILWVKVDGFGKLKNNFKLNKYGLHYIQSLKIGTVILQVLLHHPSSLKNHTSTKCVGYMQLNHNKMNNTIIVPLFFEKNMEKN